eukprot:gene19292-25936_t
MKTSFNTRRPKEVHKCADSMIITQLMELTTALELPTPNVSAQCDETSDVRRHMQGVEVTHSHDEVLSRSLQQAEVQACTRSARYTIELILALGTDTSGIKAVVTEWMNIVQTCTRSARYTIELIVALGTDLSGVKALVAEWVDSKLPPDCPTEELVFAEGSIVRAIYFPNEDEVPVSCPEWTLQAIAGLSTETRTDVVLADCLIPPPSPPKPPTPPPTPGDITPGGTTPEDFSSELTPIPPPADDDSSAPLGAIIGGVHSYDDDQKNYLTQLKMTSSKTLQKIEVVQESHIPAGPSDLATSAASLYGPIFSMPNRDISSRASRSKSHTQGSWRGSQVEAIPQDGPRLNSRSSANLFLSSSPRLSAAAWRQQRNSLDVSTVRSQNQDPMGSAYTPDWNLATSPRQNPVIEPYAYPREPGGLISEPYMTGVLSGLAAAPAFAPDRSTRASTRNSIRAGRSVSHTQGFKRGSHVETSPQTGPRLAVSPRVDLYSSGPQMSAGTWMQHTSLDGSTDSRQNQSPIQSDYAQVCDLAPPPRRASMIEPDSYPGEPGDRVSKPGSPYSTQGSLFSTKGSSFSTPGCLFSHSPDRGSEMGPMLPTRKSHNRPSVSYRTSSTPYPEVATQVADRARCARLSDRKSFNGIDKRKADRLSRLSGSSYMPWERRAYSISGSTSAGSPVTAASSPHFFKRKMDVEAPTESVGREMDPSDPPPGAIYQAAGHQEPTTIAIRSSRNQATIAGTLSRKSDSSQSATDNAQPAFGSRRLTTIADRSEDGRSSPSSAFDGVSYDPSLLPTRTSLMKKRRSSDKSADTSKKISWDGEASGSKTSLSKMPPMREASKEFVQL